MTLAPATRRRPGRLPAILLLAATLVLALSGQRPPRAQQAAADPAEPLDLKLLGQAGGPARAVAVEAARGLVYLGAGSAVSVLQDSGREGLGLIGRGEPLEGAVAGLTAGNAWLAAWAEAGDSLVLMDTGDAARPVVTARIQDLPGPVTHALRIGDRLYLSLGAAGLAAYQLGDGAPTALFRLPLPGWAGHLAAVPINGRQTAYVALGAAGLAVVDVEDGASPVVLATIAGHVEGVAAWGSMAYLAQREALPGGGVGATRLAIYDLSRPTQPRRIVEPRPDFSVGPRPVTDGVLLYSCAGNPAVLEPIDVRSPQQPVRRGFLSDPPLPPRWLQCAAVATNGARVYVASWSDGALRPEDRHGGIALYQRQASSRLAFQQSVDLRGNVGRLLVDGGRAWLTDGAAAGTPSTGLRDVDIGDPRRPLLGSRYSLEAAPSAAAPGTPTPFAPAGDLLAAPDWVHVATTGRYHRLERAGKGLVPESQLTLPLTDPVDAPPRLARWPTGVTLALAGVDPGYLLRMAPEAGGPPAVAHQGVLHRSGLVTDLAPSDAGLLATVRQGGLRVLDPDAPDADWERASLALPAESLAVEADGSLAFVANGDAGLIAVDLNDPPAPVELSRNLWHDGLAAPAAIDLALDGAAAWNGGQRGLVILEREQDPRVGAAVGQLRLVDAGDPRLPRSLLSLAVPAARALVLSGDLVLLASEDEVLEVYRISGVAPSPTPSPSPSPVVSPGTSTPSPSATVTQPSETAPPTPPASSTPSQFRSRTAWLPILGLGLDRRRELYLLLDGHLSADADADWALRRLLAEQALANLRGDDDGAALLRFDAERATLEATGHPQQVLRRLAGMVGTPGQGGRLDLALAGVDTAAAGLPPAPDRRDRILLILGGPGAATAGSAAGRAAALRRVAAFVDDGVRVFALVDPSDRWADWAGLVKPARFASRADPAAAGRTLAAWIAQGWR